MSQIMARRMRSPLGLALCAAALTLGCSRRLEPPPAPVAPAKAAPAPARGSGRRPAPAPEIAVEPHDRIYFFVVRGEGGAKEVVLTSRLGPPLAIRGVASDNPLFQASARPLEPGRRFRVQVTLDPRAAAGRHQGTVRVATDSSRHPAVEIPVRAEIQELVSAVPDHVYFGLVRAADLGQEVVSRRTVLVERHRGKGFRLLGAASDLPFLDLAVAPQRGGESYHDSVRVAKARARRGKLAGTLVLRTNDPVFRELRLPVTGTIL